MSKTYRVFFSVDKETYEYLQARANTELRKLGDMARYLMIKGVERDDPSRSKVEQDNQT
jgi:hypothetical protein